MRVMVLVKACKESESGVMPIRQKRMEMRKFNDELVKAGFLIRSPDPTGLPGLRQLDYSTTGPASQRTTSMPTLLKTRWLLVLWLLALISPTTYGQSLPEASAREARLSSSALQQIDALLQQTVERKQIAGAVALLAHDGKLGYLRAKGFQDVHK